MIEPIKKANFDYRLSFLELLPKNCVCAELGCYKAALSFRILQINQPKRFFIVDPYWKAYGDKFYGQNRIGTVDYFNRAIAQLRLEPNYNVVTFVIEFDTVFLQDYPDDFFDWVYLDSTHLYEDTLVEMELLQKKVKDDGLICGHDYASSRHRGLTKALWEWLEKNQDYELYLIDNFMQWIVRKKT